MRRPIYADSFREELAEILVYIDERFGELVRRQVQEELADTCSLLCQFPALGKKNHGYPTSLSGFVFRLNWIFFEYDDEQVRFLHIIDARRGKDSIRFDEHE